MRLLTAQLIIVAYDSVATHTRACSHQNQQALAYFNMHNPSWSRHCEFAADQVLKEPHPEPGWMRDERSADSCPAHTCFKRLEKTLTSKKVSVYSVAHGSIPARWHRDAVKAVGSSTNSFLHCAVYTAMSSLEREYRTFTRKLPCSI